MARILILIGGHLCTAPRPQKEAEALTAAGHQVTIRGVWFDPELVRRDRVLATGRSWRFAPALDLSGDGVGGALRSLRARLGGRVARQRFTRGGSFSPSLLGHGAREMLSIARADRPDLTIVHSEVGLWVGDQLLADGATVGVDFEDWFSEDLLLEARLHRPIADLRRLERQLCNRCDYRLTTSHALARALGQAYDAAPPAVVYNAFPRADGAGWDGARRDRSDRSLPSLHWFSQTIGPGRGLELLLTALPRTREPLQLHLRGKLSSEARIWLEGRIPPEWRGRIHVHDTVPNAELPVRIAEHDIGLSLEMPYCPNRDLTVTNKLLQYLTAGLAVIATETAGQREVFGVDPEIGALVPPDGAEALADAIDGLLGSPARLDTARRRARSLADDHFSWEKQASVVVEAAERAVGTRAAARRTS